MICIYLFTNKFLRLIKRLKLLYSMDVAAARIVLVCPSKHSYKEEWVYSTYRNRLWVVIVFWQKCTICLHM
jgi:hypothetical protein